MEHIKRNPVFFSFCLGSILVFIVLIALVFFESVKLSNAKAQVMNVDGQVKALMYANPAPTNKNVKAAQKNLEELEERLKNIYEELRQGSYLNINEDGVSVISSILRYISEYNKLVENHVDANSTPSPIKIPDEFAFGFEKYFRSTLIPEGKIVPVLDKQRQILSYILDKLIAADPSSIQSVKREDSGNSETKSEFKIDPAISARVPGAIDTLAFQVTFTGYTPSLRKFLNNLAYFQLPVVVRSIEVDRVESKPENQSSRFFNTMDMHTSSSKDDSKIPVISEIESVFTVTLEFIEIIAPLDFEDDLS
jgi:hypothetical protein